MPKYFRDTTVLVIVLREDNEFEYEEYWNLEYMPLCINIIKDNQFFRGKDKDKNYVMFIAYNINIEIRSDNSIFFFESLRANSQKGLECPMDTLNQIFWSDRKLLDENFTWDDSRDIYEDEEYFRDLLGDEGYEELLYEMETNEEDDDTDDDDFNIDDWL